MPEEKDFSRGEEASEAKVLKKRIETEIASMLEEAREELAEAPWPYEWEVFALGPFQGPGLAPGRIIKLGETAYIVTIVWLSPLMNANEAGHGAKVSLNYFTANTELMEPVEDEEFAHYSCCFKPNAAVGDPVYGSFYVTVWKFVPTEAGCILETNICARLCTCQGVVIPGYAAFVRWVVGVGMDNFFPPTLVTFDHPIRYLVYDDKDNSSCECTEDCLEIS